jgi:hypothetical protein
VEALGALGVGGSGVGVLANASRIGGREMDVANSVASYAGAHRGVGGGVGAWGIANTMVRREREKEREGGGREGVS